MQKKIIPVLFFLLISVAISATPADTIRVLAVGNSFSEDAVENYLYDLGKADNVVFIIGNMYIGGCSLERHWYNAQKDTAAYSYRKIGVDGIKKTTERVKLSTAITDEEWNYITLQQASLNSGKYHSYFPYLIDLQNYIKNRATNSDVKYAMHMTWAYAQASNHAAFSIYNTDQIVMYDSIVAAVSRVSEKTNIDLVIPVGTAIQNGRTSYLGDTFCRDDHHLHLLTGRYTAACTWYRKLTGKSVVGNGYVPAGLSAADALIAQKGAEYAVNSPYSVTDLSEIEQKK